MHYQDSPYRYQRRQTREIAVSNPQQEVRLGADCPIVYQSMITSDTLDTEACVQQSLDLAEVGCQLVRITAQTARHAANLEHISRELRSRGCYVPLVADIHFKPDAAMEAIKWVEVVRVNPGNYADSKKFKTHEYSDEEYEAELIRIEEKFVPLVEQCKKLNRALRIGTNHGSLSDRIMNRYGDTPLGMVESALEFARIARKKDFHNFKFSMKSSNPKVMIECYRLLVARLNELGPDWNYPIHLGVTEAGDGEDGRVKSAIGIGALLCDGLGDTIRVSLTEDAPNEIPVCRDLLAQIPHLTQTAKDFNDAPVSFDPFEFSRRASQEITLHTSVSCGGVQTIRVLGLHTQFQACPPKPEKPDVIQAEGDYIDSSICEVDPTAAFELPGEPCLMAVKDGVDLPVIAAYRLLVSRLKTRNCEFPILLKDTITPDDKLTSDIALLRSSVNLGSLIADGIGDAILVRNEQEPKKAVQLAYTILQAAGCRSFKTDYVACPSCGRTLFNLQSVTARIKARTGHLTGVKIAIMGCIVNGPGEMADADFGYVGGAPGKINLYVGKQPVQFNIPEADAVEQLVELIRDHGKWKEVEPVAQVDA
ncbi:MAG: (E)-4-hydroxy-3-methylbut-2-enyl-diphosphate synthase [Verrucomicrobia bacterium]|jgi:(E)-4-hydroxy-3-methylbut-2-enyl-diphosphate synthase|nr:(E)-4-hydroxy-3-methylbut-2-enyl-diphosphate synthase [Verrucomicrobiota bacterium]